MKISTFNVNKFQGPYSNPNTKGGYYNPRNIDFKTPIKNLCSRYLKNEDDIIFVQEFYDDNKVRTKEYFEKNGYKVFHNSDKIFKSHVVAITLKKSLWEIINSEEREFQNKFIEMGLKEKSLKIISFHNTDEKIVDRMENEFDRGDRDIILGDFNNTKWIDNLHKSPNNKYRDLVTNDMITYKPAQTSIDRIFINKYNNKYKIIFNGVIETYISDHNFLTFTLNI